MSLQSLSSEQLEEILSIHHGNSRKIENYESSPDNSDFDEYYYSIKPPPLIINPKDVINIGKYNKSEWFESVKDKKKTKRKKKVKEKYPQVTIKKGHTILDDKSDYIDGSSTSTSFDENKINGCFVKKDRLSSTDKNRNEFPVFKNVDIKRKKETFHSIQPKEQFDEIDVVVRKKQVKKLTKVKNSKLKVRKLSENISGQQKKDYSQDLEESKVTEKEPEKRNFIKNKIRREIQAIMKPNHNGQVNKTEKQKRTIINDCDNNTSKLNKYTILSKNCTSNSSTDFTPPIQNTNEENPNNITYCAHYPFNSDELSFFQTPPSNTPDENIEYSQTCLIWDVEYQRWFNLSYIPEEYRRFSIDNCSSFSDISSNSLSNSNYNQNYEISEINYVNNEGNNVNNSWFGKLFFTAISTVLLSSYEYFFASDNLF